MKAKILVVEDEPLFRMLAVELLEETGFEALEASNADEAILILERNPDIRILMTDINMLGSMDGLRLASVVRERCSPVEIVVVSAKQALDPAKLPERAVFLPKPYDIDKLSKTLVSMAA
jgi:CheY-like chemotaxis protein